MQPADFLGGLEKTMEHKVFIDPLLANSQLKYITHSSLLDYAVELAGDLYSRYGQIDKFVDLGDLPYSQHVARLCFFETLLSTAMVAAHQRTGDMLPAEEDLQNAAKHTAEMILQVGIEVLYTTYYYVIGHDLLQPFAYHKEMTEYDFFSAIRHYPYSTENLDIILPIALYRRVLRLVQRDGQRVLTISKIGTQVYQWTHQCLLDSHYIQRRIQLSYVYQFDSLKDWDELSNMVWPIMDRVRTDYIEWLRLPSDLEILEVACGTGALTFDAGLYQHVGERGRLIGIDKSNGMLAEAKKKQNKFGSPANVSFELASVEDLSFASNSFDLCLGSFFLHFVHAEKAILEMMRVVRPGGTVSVFQAFDFDLNKPFFQEWFQPILELARNRSQSIMGTYMPQAQAIPAWFKEAGLEEIEMEYHSSPWVFDNPESTVQYIVRGVNSFQKELYELPWDDRKTLIDELIQRGQDVRRRYPLAERRIELPGVMIRGTKPHGS